MTFAFLTHVTAWWDQLDLARQVFYGIGVFAGFVAVVLALLAMLGMEHHDAVDAISAADVDHGGGGIFSIKPLTGFFIGFGWAGGIALDGGLGLLASLGVALFCGCVLMAIIVMMFRGIYAMRSDGTMRIEDALNAMGTVYIALPPSKAAGGQVVVSFHGRQETLAALNISDRPIPSGERVKVVQVIDGHTVLVEPL